MDNNIELQWSYDEFATESVLDLYASRVYPSFVRETVLEATDISGKKIIRSRRRIKLELVVHFIASAINDADYKWMGGEPFVAGQFKIKFYKNNATYTNVVNSLPDSFFTDMGSSPYDKQTDALFLASYSEGFVDDNANIREMKLEFQSIETYYK